MFVADLVRRIDLPLRVAFITASSYRGSATTPGRLEVHDELLPDLTDRHVLLLDDILDTGKTLTRVVAHLINRGAASVKVGVLLRKLGRQEVPFEPDFVGFAIPDKFVVGYGLDFNDEYRHLPYHRRAPCRGVIQEQDPILERRDDDCPFSSCCRTCRRMVRLAQRPAPGSLTAG